ncbi:glycoside hydrolase family 6 protein, partial [Mycena floridula]
HIQALAPELTQYPAHFIVDQSRSGVQHIRNGAIGNYPCNVKGAGFGLRKCDRTSNTSSPRFDAHCGQSDATQPAPEASTWFQAFFETLVASANPPL